MGATYTRQSSYADGDVITAAHTNDEFNQLLAAFAASTGHTHDGTTAEGGPITKMLGTSLTLGDGTAATDITVTFDGETNDGVLKWMEDEDYFEYSDDILIASTEKLQFRDTAIYINSSADGQLDIVADTEVQIAATTIDINGDADVSGTLTYGSLSDGSITITAFVDEDNMASDSATLVPTQQSVKAYVDSQVTAQDLDFSADTGGALSIDLDSESLTLTGGTGIDTAGAGNSVTFAIDSTVATLTGTQTLTNKTIDVDNNTVSNIEVDNLKSGVLDTDLTTVAATDTTLASAKAIKTYVDAQITAQDLDFQADTGGALSIDLDTETMTFTGGTGIDTSGAGNAVTFAIDSTVATLTGTQTLTNKSIDASQLTGTINNLRLDAQLQDVAGLAVTDGNIIVGNGTNFVAESGATARASLGLTIGTDVQAYDAQLADVAGLTPTDGNFIVGNGTNFVPESGATARTSLGLGSIATQDANNVTITGGSVSGITDLAVADGGTGASTASDARTNLGVAIGSDVQAYDAGLTSIAGLTTAADKIIYTTASDTYAVTDFTAFGRSLVDDADAAAGRTTLGLGTAATQDVGTSANNVVQLDGTGELPAVDGSQLTNINFTEQDPSALAFAIALG